MSTVDLDHFRQKLVTERERIAEAVRYLSEEAPNSDGGDAQETRLDDHFADSASVTYDREMDYSLEDNAEQLLARIDGALQRIEAGTNGRCVNCGKEIPVERLEAIPYAEYCIDDARERRA